MESKEKIEFDIDPYQGAEDENRDGEEDGVQNNREEQLTIEDLETSRENSSQSGSSTTASDSSNEPRDQSEGSQGGEPPAPITSNQSPIRRRTHLRSYLAASGGTVDVNRLLSALLSSLYQRTDGSSPAGTEPREAAGGYPDDMFHPPLTEQQRQQFECSICLQVAAEAKECLSGHLFCASCILIWSLSGGAARAKCPVCRSPGKYRPAEKVQQALSGKMVKCLVEGCLWTGQLRRYRAHKIAKHGQDDIQLEGGLDSTNLSGHPAGDLSSPSYVMPRLDLETNQQDTQNSRSNSRAGRSYDEIGGNINRGRQRLQNMFASFEQRLVRRRRNIDAAYQERETQRRENMREIETLGRRLDSVSSNLMRLLDKMSRDSQRYRRYIREMPRIPDMPSLQLPDHIPDSSRQLREHIAAASKNSRSRNHVRSTRRGNHNSENEPLVTDLSNQNEEETRSSTIGVPLATRSRGRQSTTNSIYKSSNLVTDTRTTRNQLTLSVNTPRLTRNRHTNGSSRLISRSQDNSARLSAPSGHLLDRQRFSTRL